MVAESAVDQAPIRADLDQHHVGGQRDGVVLNRWVQLRPARSRYGPKDAAAVKTEAAAVEPIQTRPAEVQSGEGHASKG